MCNALDTRCDLRTKEVSVCRRSLYTVDLGNKHVSIWEEFMGTECSILEEDYLWNRRHGMNGVDSDGIGNFGWEVVLCWGVPYDLHGLYISKLNLMKHVLQTSFANKQHTSHHIPSTKATTTVRHTRPNLANLRGSNVVR